MKTLKDRVIVITGASSGIGEAMAKVYAAQGARVVLGARSVQKLQLLAGEIRTQGGQAAYCGVDVTKPESVKAIKIFTLMVIPLAVQYTIVDGFTGISAVRYAISLSCFRKALYFGAMIVFPLMFGIENIFYAEPVVDVISVIVSSFVYFKVMNNILEKRRNMIDFKGEKV